MKDMEDTSNFIEKMMELGIGMSMIKQMPGIMEGCMPNIAPAGNAQVQTATPPPIQTASTTYIVVDNAQAGPFTDDELVKLIQNDLLKVDTLVWKNGMAGWQPAAQVPDVNKLFILAKIK